ncbi:MAG: Uma2 family endonuclease [Phycisphaerae bacterium]|nr:Uma2 family endonuclease [Phycisphaerae bacterium]
MTASRFERVAANLGPCELVRGEVIPMSPGGMGHSGITTTITMLLGDWAKRNKTGRVYTAELGLITKTDPDTVRGADVAYYSFERLPRGAETLGFSDVPPNLVVEVVGIGQSWPYMLEKSSEYLQMGVDRVWIVDAKRRSLCIVRADKEPTVLNARQMVSDAEVLPKFRCRVADLFAV